MPAPPAQASFVLIGSVKQAVPGGDGSAVVLTLDVYRKL